MRDSFDVMRKCSLEDPSNQAKILSFISSQKPLVTVMASTWTIFDAMSSLAKPVAWGPWQGAHGCFAVVAKEVDQRDLLFFSEQPSIESLASA